jgi:hypothetical protein
VPSTQPDQIYVVFSAVTGPLAAYRNFGLANRHAETMVGVEVRVLNLRSSLPPEILDIIVTTDYDVEDPTPVDDIQPVPAPKLERARTEPVLMQLDELEDAPDDAETRVVDVPND